MSRLPFELFLALRYLRPKRTFVSVITLISIVGVTLGVAVLIIVISVMTGFDRQLREKLLGFNSHLKISQGGSLLRNYGEVMKRRLEIPDAKMRVIHNGIELAGYSVALKPPAVPTVGYFARIGPALAMLTKL